MCFSGCWGVHLRPKCATLVAGCRRARERVKVLMFLQTCCCSASTRSSRQGGRPLRRPLSRGSAWKPHPRRNCHRGRRVARGPGGSGSGVGRGLGDCSLDRSAQAVEERSAVNLGAACTDSFRVDSSPLLTPGGRRGSGSSAAVAPRWSAACSPWLAGRFLPATSSGRSRRPRPPRRAGWQGKRIRRPASFNGGRGAPSAWAVPLGGSPAGCR